MDIKIYSPDLVFLGVIEDYSSLIWRRKYYEPGEFELYAAATQKNMELLKAGNIITKSDSKEAGIIQIHDDREEDGGYNKRIIRKGRFLSFLLNYRLIKGTINFNDTAEVVMRQMVSAVKPIKYLSVAPVQGHTQRTELQVTWKAVQPVLTKIARATGLGYQIRPDFEKKKLIFEVINGTDRSILQQENPFVVFSKGYGNLKNVSRIYDETDYRDVFYIGGEGEGELRKIVTIGNMEAEDVREVFIDAKDLQQGESTEEEYRLALLQRGEEKKAEYTIVESAEAAVFNYNFKYRQDWDLGDIVTMKHEDWNIILNKRITEVTEITENGSERIEPTFGSPLPERLDLSED